MSVWHPGVTPEFFVQLHDRNLLGGPLFDALLRALGFAAVAALCAVLSAGALVLVAVRTRLRGAPPGYAALAVALAAICIAGRVGVSLDPIGWACAAGFALMLDRQRTGIVAALSIVALWSALQGGAPLGAVLAAIAFASALRNARGFDQTVRNKAAVAGGALVLGALQLHGAPWHAYGAHALYLDAFMPGAQRDRLWNGGFSLQSAAFCAAIVSAGWFGLRRCGRPWDAPTFFALALLTIADARNLPYLGILAAPMLADATARRNGDSCEIPHVALRRYAGAFCVAGCAAFFLTAAFGAKSVRWPQAPDQPAALLRNLARDRRPHRLLCQQPRWCDGVNAAFPAIDALLDDRAGIARGWQLRTQRDAVATRGPWRRELERAGVDSVIAQNDSNIVALLASTGWHESKADSERVLLRKGGAQ